MSRRIVESVRIRGDIFIFDDDWNEPDGRVRQMEHELKGHQRVPRHVHRARSRKPSRWFPATLGVQIKRKRWILRPGEQITTGPGDVHAQWNQTAAPVRVIERYDPPLDIEPFFKVRCPTPWAAEIRSSAQYSSRISGPSAPRVVLETAENADPGPAGRARGAVALVWRAARLGRRSTPLPHDCRKNFAYAKIGGDVMLHRTISGALRRSVCHGPGVSPIPNPQGFQPADRRGVAALAGLRRRRQRGRGLLVDDPLDPFRRRLPRRPWWSRW